MSTKQEVTKLGALLDEHYYMTHEFAKVLGVGARRVRQLMQDGRIEDVVSIKGRQYIPHDARILRGDRIREGKISDYIDAWERRHPDRVERYADPWTREATKDIERTTR